MKNPMFAFVLSFLLPGAGLAYLGKWTWAGINFGGVVLLAALAAFLLPDEFFEHYSRYIGLGWSVGSGSVAKIMAEQYNKTLSVAPAPEMRDAAAENLLGTEDATDPNAPVRRYISDDIED